MSNHYFSQLIPLSAGTNLHDMSLIRLAHQFLQQERISVIFLLYL